MTKPIVTVVIPAFRRTESVCRAVRSIFAQDLDPEKFELMVVDSSPDDLNVRALEELRASAPCEFQVLTKEPEGPGPSRNLGAKTGRGEFIAFMDSDCEAAPGWLKAGIAAFEDAVGIVQGRTTYPPGARPGIFFRYISVEEENYIYEACNIFFRRSAFEASGGFWADLAPHAVGPMGGEDTTIAWTVKRMGWKSLFCRGALVHHEVIPITPWQWLYRRSLFIFPKIVRHAPEVREFFVAGVFLDSAQAFLVLGLAGTIGAVVTPWSLILWLPYLITRASEPTRTLTGPLRLLRCFFYFPKDFLSFLILLAGSLRYRRLVL